VHAKHLMVENRKMSKRDGHLLHRARAPGPGGRGAPELGQKLVDGRLRGGKVTAPVLRLGLMWSHYRAP
jgi:hypothetical protein